MTQQSKAVSKEVIVAIEWTIRSLSSSWLLIQDMIEEISEIDIEVVEIIEDNFTYTVYVRGFECIVNISSNPQVLFTSPLTSFFIKGNQVYH